MGTEIDKFLHVPGYFIPPTILQPSGTRLADPVHNVGEPHCPAAVLDETLLGDRFPLLLQLPCDERELQDAPHRRFGVNNLDEEQR